MGVGQKFGKPVLIEGGEPDHEGWTTVEMVCGEERFGSPASNACLSSSPATRMTNMSSRMMRGSFGSTRSEYGQANPVPFVRNSNPPLTSLTLGSESATIHTVCSSIIGQFHVKRTDGEDLAAMLGLVLHQVMKCPRWRNLVVRFGYGPRRNKLFTPKRGDV